MRWIAIGRPARRGLTRQELSLTTRPPGEKRMDFAAPNARLRLNEDGGCRYADRRQLLDHHDTVGLAGHDDRRLEGVSGRAPGGCLEGAFLAQNSCKLFGGGLA